MTETYATRSRNAETVTAVELATMLEADNNPDVYPRPRSPRQIAIGARLSGDVVTYTRCTRGTGRLVFDCVYLSRLLSHAPIFHFATTGRTVQVAR